MEIAGTVEAGGASPLPAPPTSIPFNEKQALSDTPKHSIISRRGFGSSGRSISLLSNHFKVSINFPDKIIYQYNVLFTSEDKRVVESKGLGRKIIDKLFQTYSSELGQKRFAYDGEKSLFTVGPLPQNNFELTVVLEETFVRRDESGTGGAPIGSGKRSKRCFQSRTFNVQISHAAKIPLKSISLALQGAEAVSTQDALRVLDIILRQQAVNRGCLLVRQSFFQDDSRNFVDVGGGVTGCKGFHSSFRTIQGGLSLNMDVSTTMIITPGPVIDFLKANQNVREPRQVDWARARKMLKNLRIRTKHSGMDFKIIGLSDKPCNQQYFPLKVKTIDSANNEEQTLEITVYDYFTQHLNIELSYSAYLPCLDVGRPKRPTYLPLELCSLVSLQRYTKALSMMQRSSFVEKSRQKPHECIRIVIDAMRNYRYDEDPMLAACGININKQLNQVEGRILEAPKLKVGNNEDCIPHSGRWNFNNKAFLSPFHIKHWAVVNFSSQCDTSHLSRELINCGRKKGIRIDRPCSLFEEDPQCRRGLPVFRVEKMFEVLLEKIRGHPEFLLCVLPEKKNCDIYGPWKKKCLCDFGVVTQCASPSKINDQYLTNLLLKINSKLGGTNSLLAIELPSRIPLIKDAPTMILGMDVSHGSPGQSDIPSIAAVVGSRSWPHISKYRAGIRTQSPKVEMIDSLYKPLENGEDVGIIRELLLEFYHTSNACKPKQIILFRDGVSESQFNQVLNIELEQIIKAYENLGAGEIPKFTVIVAQKNHHTKLFLADAAGNNRAGAGSMNVPPGTVVDRKIVHPRNYDFYMCAHEGKIGTSRPVHYHVLLDEIGFSPDELQNLIHSLSYVYQRSTTAVSLVAPICYAHLAAKQAGQFVKFEDSSETSSQSDVTTVGSVPVPELPKLHKNVRRSMFFC